MKYSSHVTIMSKLFLLSIFIIILYADSYYYDGDKKIYLTSVEKQTRDFQKNSSQFKTQNDTYLSVDNRIILKLKTGIDIQTLIAEYNLIYIKRLYTNTYLLQINNNEDIFDVSNTLHLDKRTIFSHPNFNRIIKTR